MGTVVGNFFRKVADVAVGVTDSALSVVGAGGVIPNSAYSSSKSAQAWNMVQDSTNAVKNTVLNVVAPGSGTLLGGLQKLNPSQRSSGSSPSPTTPTPQASVPQVAFPSGLSGTGSQVQSQENQQNYLPFIIVGAILLILLVLIISFLKK